MREILDFESKGEGVTQVIRPLLRDRRKTRCAPQSTRRRRSERGSIALVAQENLRLGTKLNRNVSSSDFVSGSTHRKWIVTDSGFRAMRQWLLLTDGGTIGFLESWQTESKCETTPASSRPAIRVKSWETKLTSFMFPILTVNIRDREVCLSFLRNQGELGTGRAYGLRLETPLSTPSVPAW